MTATDPTEFLVLQAQSGDRAAMEQLLVDLHRRLRSYVAGMVGEDDAEDVLQECLFRIARHLRWLSEPLAFRVWTYRVAHRAALSHLRRERRWRQQLHDEELLASVPDPDGGRSPGIEASDVRSIIGKCPPRSRDVLLMHYVESMTLEEIALVLGVPPGTVKSRLAYGLTVARRILKPQGASQ